MVSKQNKFEKKPFASKLRQSRDSFVEWRSALKKEEKETLKANIMT